MGFIVNKKTKTIHKEDCSFVKENYEKTKNKRECNFVYFKTEESAKHYFVKEDKKYRFCKICLKK